MDRPEYRLTWSGQKDSPKLRAAVKYLSTSHLFRDAKARLIDHVEYAQLVAEDKIRKPESWWQIKKGKVGLISLNYYAYYTKTWDQISTAKGDFEAGWHACESFNK